MQVWGAAYAPGVGRATGGLVAMPPLLAMQHSHALGYTLQHQLHPQQARDGQGGGRGEEEWVLWKPCMISDGLSDSSNSCSREVVQEARACVRTALQQ